MTKLDDLKFFKSGEWDVIQERLDDLETVGIPYCPARENLFAAFDFVDLEDVKVVVVGQDPYPNPKHATGIAFSVPKGTCPLPPTLCNIFGEYKDDLQLDYPIEGDLSPWCKEGVLLMNAIPSCEAFKSGSHRWDEWTYFTKEVLETLDQRGDLVFIFLGQLAQGYIKYLKYTSELNIISTSHPANFGANKGFFGSRIFTQANTKLKEMGKKPINWKL